MSDAPVRMETEWQEAPRRCDGRRNALEAPLAELLRRLRRRSAGPGADMRARKLGPFGDLRKASDRAPSRHTGRRLRAQHRNHLSAATEVAAASSFSRSRKSGRSDDLIESAAMAKAAGALTATIVNDTDSPLAKASDIVLPMAAGPELSVAATKSFVTSLSAWLHVVAGWAALDSTAGVDRPSAGPARGRHATRLERRAESAVRGRRAS